MKYVITLNGKNYEVEVDKAEAAVTAVTDAAPQAAPVAAAPVAAAPAAPASAAPAAAPADGTKIIAPMPGAILSVNVSVGNAVKAGDIIVILEAMKMENEIVAPCDGTVKQVLTQKGSSVNTDDILAVIG